MSSVVAQDTLRVLVVDDEASIRRFAERTRTRATTLWSHPMDQKPCVWWTRSRVRLTSSSWDVLMPEMRGDELSRQLRQRDPDVKVLYFTGYSDRLFAEREVLWENEAFIEEPVTVKGSLEAVSLLPVGHTDGPRRHLINA